MGRKTEGLRDTARLLRDLLRACFGTIMVEPERWNIVSSATPSRGALRYAIMSGRAVFTESVIESVGVLFNAALQTGADTSAHDPNLVARKLTDFLKERDWGDFGELAEGAGNARLIQVRRKALASMVEAIAAQLYQKADIEAKDEMEIGETLQRIASQARRDMKAMEDPEDGLLSTETLPASVEILMRQIDFPEEDGFLSATDEQNMWIALCELYCSGVKVDAIIRAALEQGAVARYGAQSEAAMTYYIAKFDLKRGNVRQSNEDLGRLNLTLRENKSKIDGACVARMNALADIRTLTNNAEPSADHATRFERAIGSLQDLSYAGDDYKAYETASAIGAEITNALAKGPVEDRRAVASFNGLVTQHEAIVRENPEKLGNQAVVAISLKWFMELSRLTREPVGERGTQKLFAIALDGLLEARKRKNSLFHVQCVVVIAICALCEEDEDLFISLGFIAAKLKRAFEIKETQEGIWQLTAIMNKMAPGSSKRLLADPDVQMELMKSRHSPIINWTMHLDEMYRHEMIPGKRAYRVKIEEEVLKLEVLRT